MPRPNAPLAAPLPAPRFAPAWAALAYAIATLFLGYPALGGQFLVSPHSDQYIAGYAFREFAAQSLRAGHGFPLWNPYLFGGLPYVQAMHGDIFYPSFLLRLVMPTDAAMTWGFILHVFLAGLFTFGFLRAWGLGFYPSLVGGLAYLLSGPIASYVSPGHDGKLFVSALLPLALWLVVRGVRDGRAWAWGTFALVVGMAEISPHPQLFQYFLLLAGAFALFCAFGPQPDGSRLDRATAVRRLAFALAAVIIGAAIGAVQYLPVREYVAWSPRAGGRGYEFATQFSFPIEELINIYLPQFSGILDRYWGRNGIHLHSEFLGVVVLFLAGAGLRSTRRPFRWFWIGTAIVSLLWALGEFTPFYHIVYAIVPGTKFFRAPSTIIFIFAFSAAVLAALGLEEVLARRVGVKYATGWAIAGLVIALLASAGAFTNLGESIARGAWTDFYASRGADASLAAQAGEQYAARAEANGEAVIMGGWRSFLFVAIAAGLLLAYLRGQIGARTLTWSLVVTIALDLWSVEKQYWGFSPPASVLYAPDPATEFLKAHSATSRVLVMAQGDSGLAHPDPYFGTDGQGRGTGLMVHGIRSATGYHGNQLGRYEELSEAQLGSSPAIATPMFWRHENVRYLYTNAPLAIADFKKVVGPVKNSAGSTVYVYELPGDNPPAWVAAAVAKAPDSTALQAILNPQFDQRRIAVVSDTTALGVPTLSALPEPLPQSVTVARPSDDRIDVTLGTPAPAGAMLVMSENYLPGWRATVNGTAATSVRADFNLIGVPLTPNARAISLTFHDPSYHTGKIVTWIALILSLVLIAVGAAADRRRPAGA